MNPATQYFLGWALNGLAAFLAYKYPPCLPLVTGFVGLVVGKLHLPQPTALVIKTDSPNQ